MISVMAIKFAIVCLAAMPNIVLAAPPQPQLNRTASPLMGFGLMFLLAVVVVAISLMPSKRSHLD